jgi:quercetin dioxygenase-like cupin family protein
MGATAMPIVIHAELPIHEVPRIRTRVLVSAATGAAATAVWEQWIKPDGYVPLHYHEVEEVLVLLAGEVVLTESDKITIVRAPATATLPAGVIHGLRPRGSGEVHLLAFFPTAAPTIYTPDGKLRPLPWEDLAADESPP